jgi:hypothetical protein
MHARSRGQAICGGIRTLVDMRGCMRVPSDGACARPWRRWLTTLCVDEEAVVKQGPDRGDPGEEPVAAGERAKSDEIFCRDASNRLSEEATLWFLGSTWGGRWDQLLLGLNSQVLAPLREIEEKAHSFGFLKTATLCRPPDPVLSTSLLNHFLCKYK